MGSAATNKFCGPSVKLSSVRTYLLAGPTLASINKGIYFWLTRLSIMEVRQQDMETQARLTAGKLKAARVLMVKLAHRLLESPSLRYIDEEQGRSFEKGYDCSGFVFELYRYAAEAYGLDPQIPRHANEQWRTFGEPIDYSRRKAGDLVYFPSRRKNSIRVIGHVGLVVNREQYIHAVGSDNTKVMLANLPDSPQELEDVGANDIYTYSPAGIKRISAPISVGRWHVW